MLVSREDSYLKESPYPPPTAELQMHTGPPSHWGASSDSTARGPAGVDDKASSGLYARRSSVDVVNTCSRGASWACLTCSRALWNPNALLCSKSRPPAEHLCHKKHAREGFAYLVRCSAVMQVGSCLSPTSRVLSNAKVSHQGPSTCGKGTGGWAGEVR
jgi:hypothetical protein